MAKFQTVSLSEVTTLVTKGTTPTTLGYAFTDSGVNFIKAESVTLDGQIDESVFAHIDETTHKKLKRSQIEEGDILFSIAGMKLGKSAVVKSRHVPANTNQAVAIIRADRSKALPEFLHYHFLNPDHYRYVNAITAQAAQPNINLGQVGNLPISLPPLPVQRRIAGILSAYDELIENNQRRIRILESMARALYREWFVQFKFPGHEKVKITNGIPKGWEMKCAPACLDINPRVVVPRDGEKPFVPMGCLSNDSMLITDIESRAGNSGAKFQNGDTLFARITPCLENGKTGFVQFLPDAQAVGFGSTEFIVLRSRTLTPEFVYLLARSDDFRGVAIKSMSGASGRQRVQEQCFDDFQIAQPPRALLGSFSTIVAPSFRLIYKLHGQIQNLRRTRDLLLPRLLSGEQSL